MPQIDFSRPILAIDTASSVLSLALLNDGDVFQWECDAANRQSELILPAIQNLFQQASIACGDLAAIVYNQGPGMFTGLRIGIGVAQGLAAAFDTPLVGIPSLDVLAYLLPEQQCVLAAIDARMGEVFFAWFDTANHKRLVDYQVDKASNIRLPEGFVDGVGVGNAFSLEQNIFPVKGEERSGGAVFLLSLAQSGRYAPVLAQEASLLYVRNKIALTAKEQAAAKNAQG